MKKRKSRKSPVKDAKKKAAKGLTREELKKNHEALGQALDREVQAGFRIPADDEPGAI